MEPHKDITFCHVENLQTSLKMGPSMKGCEGMQPHEKSFRVLHGPWKTLHKGTFPFWPHPLLHKTFFHNVYKPNSLQNFLHLKKGIGYRTPSTIANSWVEDWWWDPFFVQIFFLDKSDHQIWLLQDLVGMNFTGT